jgi:hypothetical protein
MRISPRKIAEYQPVPVQHTGRNDAEMTILLVFSRQQILHDRDINTFRKADFEVVE